MMKQIRTILVTMILTVIVTENTMLTLADTRTADTYSVTYSQE